MVPEENGNFETTTHRTIIMNLSDSVLRQVIEEKTSYIIWNKLNDLYVSKGIPNKMYLREKFFTFKMDPEKSLNENLDEYEKITKEFK